MNAERCRQRAAENRKRNPGRNADWRAANFDKVVQQRADYRRRNVAHMLWLSAKARTRNNDVEFELLEEDIVLNTHCPICGVEMLIGTQQAPSLDKTDPDGGYNPGNIDVICRRCNMVKSDGTSWDHFRIARYMRRMGV